MKRIITPGSLELQKQITLKIYEMIKKEFPQLEGWHTTANIRVHYALDDGISFQGYEIRIIRDQSVYVPEKFRKKID